MLGSLIGAVAGPLLGKVLGGDDNTSTTKVEEPAYLSGAKQHAINGMQNADIYYKNPDMLTAGLNPYAIENLASAANYAQGAGADQVAMMNAMGLNQAGVGDMQALLGQTQANMGAKYATGGGDYIMSILGGGRGGGGGGGFGGGGLGAGVGVPDLKFEYDQGTYDQILGNLLGVSQSAFDSYSNKTKTDNLFREGAGLQMGQALLGGANTKTGQQSALLDALTNQQIIDFGAQQSQWAAGQANAGAMSAGNANLQSATSLSNAATSAAASMANARTAANASMYASRLSAASSLFGQGAGMMKDANTSFNGANSSYGGAANTFGDANTQNINNMNTSMGAADYIQRYDQGALDRYNDAMAYNGNADFNRYNTMMGTLNGVPTGQSTTTDVPMGQLISAGMMVGNQVGNLFGTPTATGGFNETQAGHSNPMDGWWM
jgi:hypothetical protein